MKTRHHAIWKVKHPKATNTSVVIKSVKQSVKEEEKEEIEFKQESGFKSAKSK